MTLFQRMELLGYIWDFLMWVLAMYIGMRIERRAWQKKEHRRVMDDPREPTL